MNVLCVICGVICLNLFISRLFFFSKRTELLSSTQIQKTVHRTGFVAFDCVLLRSELFTLYQSETHTHLLRFGQQEQQDNWRLREHGVWNIRTSAGNIMFLVEVNAQMH